MSVEILTRTSITADFLKEGPSSLLNWSASYPILEPSENTANSQSLTCLSGLYSKTLYFHQGNGWPSLLEWFRNKHEAVYFLWGRRENVVLFLVKNEFRLSQGWRWDKGNLWIWWKNMLPGKIVEKLRCMWEKSLIIQRFLNRNKHSIIQRILHPITNLTHTI